MELWDEGDLAKPAQMPWQQPIPSTRMAPTKPYGPRFKFLLTFPSAPTGRVRYHVDVEISGSILQHHLTEHGHRMSTRMVYIWS